MRTEKTAMTIHIDKFEERLVEAVRLREKQTHAKHRDSSRIWIRKMYMCLELRQTGRDDEAYAWMDGARSHAATVDRVEELENMTVTHGNRLDAVEAAQRSGEKRRQDPVGCVTKRPRKANKTELQKKPKAENTKTLGADDTKTLEAAAAKKQKTFGGCCH